MNLAIILHVVTVLIALSCALFIFYHKKGTYQHKIAGRIFVVSLFVSALSTFWILSDSRFSFIHILSVLTLYWLIFGFISVRNKTTDTWKQKHASHMLSACIAIASAGAGVIVRHYFILGSTNAGLMATLLVVVICIPFVRRYLNEL